MKNADKVKLRPTPEGIVVSVKVVPGASRDRIAGVLGDCLKVTTSAAAEKRRANAAVARTLAGALEVRLRDVQIIAGHTNPRKQFRIAGLTAAEVLGKLREA